MQTCINVLAQIFTSAYFDMGLFMVRRDSSSYNTTLKGMQTCINILAQIFTSAYFDMGLLMKAFEISYAKSMYMQYIFPCGDSMHLLIAGFASIV